MMLTAPDGQDVVASLAEGEIPSFPPLLVVDRVTGFLDKHGLGQGPLAWQRIGDGQSNITFRIHRGGLDLVLRRGPRPPLPPSTHDMLREARIQNLLRPHGVAVPEVLAVCDDPSVLGVPFYVMEWLDGAVITDEVPPALDTVEQRRATSRAVVETLVRLHSVDVSGEPLNGLGRPDGFLERQVRRFADLWEGNTTRVLPEVERLAGWLTDNLPASQGPSVVHGDYRLGNLMYGREAPATPLALLDWEMATLGDPLTDLGYLTATWSDPGSTPHALRLSPVTDGDGFMRSEELALTYAESTGADLTALAWYQTLALWKGAVFCEAIYTRWLRGERPDDVRFGPSLATGVPDLLAAAQETAHSPLRRR
jgi:aminoglycoside phosphotransferase (APT) family kinase protein